MVAADQNPDFLLLKATTPVPSSKITVDNQNTATIHNRSINWEEYTSTPNSHFEISFDEGFSQVGASGAPMYGTDGLLYGQLHGGNINLEACEINNLYYGRLAESWEGNNALNRLSDWLDPINTGQLSYRFN